MEPLMFLLRRIIYAMTIVLASEQMFLGVYITMFCTLIMLGYACFEWQWKDDIINRQYIGDEITIYVLCVLLLCFSNFVDN